MEVVVKLWGVLYLGVSPPQANSSVARAILVAFIVVGLDLQAGSYIHQTIPKEWDRLTLSSTWKL